MIEAAAAFAHRVLGECRRLRILATSREPLGITGEALWPVEPLALVEGDGSTEGLAVRPDHRMVAHTAFLVSARKLAPGVTAPPRRRKPSKGAEAYALRRAAQAAPPVEIDGSADRSGPSPEM